MHFPDVSIFFTVTKITNTLAIAYEKNPQGSPPIIRPRLKLGMLA